MVSIFQRLIEYWNSTNTEYNLGLKENALGLAEKTKWTQLPNNLKSLLSQVNGMKENTECDVEGFRFYPLLDTYLLKESDLTIFADYLHQSWLYGINETGIYLIYRGVENASLITTSIEDFIKKYLKDDVSLYPPPND